MESQIRKWAQSSKIAFKKHTLLRMHQRSITAREIQQALICCDLVSEYPDDRPLPSFLVLGYTEKGRPLHVVVAVDVAEPMLWIITVYEPDGTRWNKALKGRK